MQHHTANPQPGWTTAQFLVRGWERRQPGHSGAMEKGLGSVFPGLGRKLKTYSHPSQSGLPLAGPAAQAEASVPGCRAPTGFCHRWVTRPGLGPQAQHLQPSRPCVSGLAGIGGAHAEGQDWEGRGGQAGGEGQRTPMLGPFIISNHSLSVAPGHWLILTSLDLPSHGKSLPFTGRLMCSVGSEKGGRRAHLLLCFKNTQTPHGRTPPWTQCPSSIWPWLLAAMGFRLGTPLRDCYNGLY